LFHLFYYKLFNLISFSNQLIYIVSLVVNGNTLLAKYISPLSLAIAHGKLTVALKIIPLIILPDGQEYG